LFERLLMSTQTSDLRLETLAASRSRSLDLASRAGVVLAASAFVAVCAHISVPLPFTPVPFTLQPFAVLLVGMVLGPAMGFAALAAYLLEGSMGLPVFTPGALVGVARLIGPTAGYLFAYPFVAAIAGGLPKLLQMRSRFAANAIGGFCAMAVLYVCAATWFSHLLHLPLWATLAGTVTPFAASDVVKVCAAAGISSALAARSRNA
jgi:biotin transport system substrate-specific component